MYRYIYIYEHIYIHTQIYIIYTTCKYIIIDSKTTMFVVICYSRNGKQKIYLFPSTKKMHIKNGDYIN